MTLWDAFTRTPTGELLPGAVPPALRVMGPVQATHQQLADAQVVFHRFLTMARLSVVPNPTAAGELPDGSRYEISVIGRVKTMLLWPVGGGVAGGPFIAWTAFFDTTHFPIWERPIVDFPYDGLPPKPEPPGPEPEYPPLASVSGLIEETEETAPGVTTRRISVFAEVPGVGKIAEASAEGTFTVTDAGCGAGHYVANIYPVVGTYSEGGESIAEVFTYTYDYVGGPFTTAVTGGIIVYHVSDPCAEDPVSVEIFVPRVNTGIRLSVSSAASSYNAGAISAFEAAHAAWEAAVIQYNADITEWNAQLEELLALNTPYLPVIAARNAARPAQVAAVKSHLFTGIGDRHLTARILSFPYNVAFRTVPPVGSGGSITHEWVVEPTQRGYKTTLVNAEPYTTWPVFEEASAETYPAHPLRRDFMPPECLFGWKVTGEMKSVDRFYAEQRAAENFMVEPTGFAGLFPSYPADYFTYTRVTSDPAPGLVVASDAFVPVGSTFTVVFFEYLTLDPRGGEEHWVICPELMQRDSIWIRNGGTYVDTPRFVDELFTQRVRLAGAITQRRTGQSTWSTPKVTTRAGLTQGNWEADFVIEVPADTTCKAPSAVVIASNLSPAAKPSAVQDGGFYLDAAHLWSGGRDAVNAARAAPWNTDGATAPQEQFIIRALIAAGRI